MRQLFILRKQKMGLIEAKDCTYQIKGMNNIKYTEQKTSKTRNKNHQKHRIKTIKNTEILVSHKKIIIFAPTKQLKIWNISVEQQM